MATETDKLIAIGMESFDRAISRVPGFRERAGQREMALEVARAFATADLGDVENPTRSYAVVSAGTGVGKSAAYLSVGVAIAKARGKKLVVSTSTVALQSQLVGKDLPMLAASSPEPFTFALVKGRSRYACRLKLARVAGGSPDPQLDLDEGETDAPEGLQAVPTEQANQSARIAVYRRMEDALAGGWAGDRDSLLDPPSPAEWAVIAADRHSCTVRACPQFSQCTYYAARRVLGQTDVLVVNHDLLLASLGSRVLPDLTEALVVLDEGHNLPAKAVSQFASEVDLTRLRWLDRLAPTLQAVSGALEVPIAPNVPTQARELKSILKDTAQIVWHNMASQMRSRDGVRRLTEAEVEALLAEPLRAARDRAGELLKIAEELGNELRSRIKDQPENSANLAIHYAALGGFVPRVSAVHQTASMLLNSGEESRTTAKWCSVDASSGIAMTLHACPVLPGILLSSHLWSVVRGAVITSATITTCGSFNWFLNEVGLRGDPAVRTKHVQSPFDFARQARLRVRKTVSEPRAIVAYNAETSNMLVQEIAELKRGGGLALFTSRRHLQSTLELLSDDLRGKVLVQGSMSRDKLMALHTTRINEGAASVIFGLASFGEGLDLAGALLEKLWVLKLPFGQPDDPVGQTRAEYVEQEGGDPFADLVVPATGVKMLQWTGRAIRTETDEAIITVFDRRIVEKSYGRRILQGLPPYPVDVIAARVPTTYELTI